MAQNDLHKAISIIKDMDIETINILLTKLDQLEKMYE
jgi:hypothetical protein